MIRLFVRTPGVSGQISRHPVLVFVIIRLSQLAACCLCVALPALAGESLRFKLVRDYVIVNQVYVNGVGPFDFMLDTGSTGTLIDLKLMKQLQLEPAGLSLVTGLAGSRQLPYVRVDRLAVGSKVVEKLELLSGEIKELRGLGSNIRGVLGLNFLSRFNYLLNYRHRRLEFEEGDEMSRHLTGSRLPIERIEGRVFVQARSPLQVTPTSEATLRLMLDSGITHLMLYEKAANRLQISVESSEWVSSLTFTGSRQTRRGLLERLRIGTETLFDVPMGSLQGRAADEAVSADGLLPTSLFLAVYFNHKEDFVILNPRQPKPEQ
nr:retropepsin-like aspartic protease [Nitrosomonas nitrosa]